MSNLIILVTIFACIISLAIAITAVVGTVAINSLLGIFQFGQAPLPLEQGFWATINIWALCLLVIAPIVRFRSSK